MATDTRELADAIWQKAHEIEDRENEQKKHDANVRARATNTLTLMGHFGNDTVESHYIGMAMSQLASDTTDNFDRDVLLEMLKRLESSNEAT